MMVECWGAIATGWVKETFVDPQISFTFIGFEWTQFLLGNTMYYIFGFLGLLGVMIMLGAFYKFSSFIFAVGWSLVYFMQKTHYNNHYYLVMLIAWFMVFIPANRYKAIDVWLWPRIRSNYTYNWTRLIFILQLLIVYTFAAVAKLYPGWMNGDFLMLRYRSVAVWANKEIQWEPLTHTLQSREFAQLFSWLGFGFDLLIVPLLLWKRTRIGALLAALFFHIFNSITLQIGIFPYFALALAVFLFSAGSHQKRIFPEKNFIRSGFQRISTAPQKPGCIHICIFSLHRMAGLPSFTALDDTGRCALDRRRASPFMENDAENQISIGQILYCGQKRPKT